MAFLLCKLRVLQNGHAVLSKSPYMGSIPIPSIFFDATIVSYGDPLHRL